jgi:hypothetical protein
VKRGVLDLIPRDKNGHLTTGNLNKFINQNKNGLRALFGDEHYQAFEQVLGDLRSADRVGEIAFLASKGNSVTAQSQRVAGTVSKLMLGSTFPGAGPLAQVAEAVAELGAIKTGEQVKELLVKAALDPAFARELAAAPTTERVMTVLQRLGQMITDSGKAGARGGLLELSRPGTDANPTAAAIEQKRRSTPAQTKTPTNSAGAKLPPTGRRSVFSESLTQRQNSSPNPEPVSLANQASSLPPEIAKEIKADKWLHATMIAESRGNPAAKNPNSSATGLFQFVNQTAKSLGIDPKNPADAVRGMKKILPEYDSVAKGDPLIRYAAHVLGVPLVKKVLSKEQLTARERELVSYFKDEALPNFTRAWEQVSA